MTRHEMSKTERAARDAMKPYVRDGLISQAEANKALRKGLTLVESVVRENYSPDQTLYYAGKVAAAREAFEAQENPVVRVVLRGKLMGWEMYAAVYAVVREEHGDTDIPTGLAEEVMSTVSETAREMRSEAETFQALTCAGTTVSRWNQTDQWGVWGSPDQAPADPGPYREGETTTCRNCGRDVPVEHRITNERETGTQYIGDLAAH